MNQEVNLQNFEQTVNSARAVIIKFSSPGCGPCKKLSQNLEQLLTEFPNAELKIYEINIAENIPLAQKFMIFSVPVLIFFLNGKEFRRINGLVKNEELKATINQLLN